MTKRSRQVSPLRRDAMLTSRARVVVIALVCVVVAGAALWVVREQLRQVARDVALVAELDQRQLEYWLSERWVSAGLTGTSFPQATMYERWTEEGDDEFGRRLFLRLTQFADAGGFSNVALLGPSLEVLWSAQPLAVDLAAAAGARWPRGVPLGSQAYLDLPWQVDGEDAIAIAVSLPTEWLTATPLVVYLLDAHDLVTRGLRGSSSGLVVDRTLAFRPTDHGLAGVARAGARNGAAPTTWERSPADADGPYARLSTGSLGALSSIVTRSDDGAWVVAAGAPLEPIGWFVVVERSAGAVALAIAPTLALAIMLASLLSVASLAGLRRVGDRRVVDAEHAARSARSERAEALRLLHAVAEGSTDAIYAKDQAGRYILCNRAASAFLGLPPEEVIGRDDRSLMPTAQAARVMEHDGDVMRRGRPITVEETVTLAGVERVFQATKGPLRDVEGAIVGVFGISRDVTELVREAGRRAEHERAMALQLAEIERFNRVLVDRELAMIDLKRQLNAAMRALGRPELFDLSQVDAGAPPDA